MTELVPTGPPPIDWGGLAFDVMASLGDDARIRFGRITAAPNGLQVTTGAAPAPPPDADLAPRVAWHALPHATTDGVGGLARLLRERGQPPATLPALLRSKPPGPLQRLKLAFEDVSGNRHPVVPWRAFDPSRRAGERSPLAYTVLGPSQTADLVAHASVRGASLNSLLLWALDRALRPALLTDPSARALWMVPVNLRGGVTLPDDTANCSSYLPVSLTGAQDAAAVHSSVRALLGRGVHWAAWSTVTMPRWLGRGAHRAIVRRYYERAAHPWLGAFSNLGEWPVRPGTPSLVSSTPPATPLADDDGAAWVFAPPPLKTVPVAAGAVTWHGRLGLMIQAHPALGVADADVAGWLTAWLAAARA